MPCPPMYGAARLLRTRTVQKAGGRRASGTLAALSTCIARLETAEEFKAIAQPGYRMKRDYFYRVTGVK